MIDKEAVRGPVAKGVNETLIAQFVPAARLAGQLFVEEKSFEMERAIPEMMSGRSPILVSVRD